MDFNALKQQAQQLQPQDPILIYLNDYKNNKQIRKYLKFSDYVDLKLKVEDLSLKQEALNLKIVKYQDNLKEKTK